MEPIATFESLTSDLRALGARGGDVLFVQASMRSLGLVDGGAQTVVSALEWAVGSEGLVLMPSFQLIERSQRSARWNLRTSPATTGWLTEYFRRMPGTLRSDHYSHSVAARGRAASEWVEAAAPEGGYSSPWDLDPWMKTFGHRSPLYLCYERGAKALMLGVGYESQTFMHLVEVMDWHRRLDSDPRAEYRWLDRVAAGEDWETHGAVHSGLVGRAPSRLFGVRAFVDSLLARVESDASLFRLNQPAQSHTVP